MMEWMIYFVVVVEVDVLIMGMRVEGINHIINGAFSGQRSGKSRDLNSKKEKSFLLKEERERERKQSKRVVRSEWSGISINFSIYLTANSLTT